MVMIAYVNQSRVALLVNVMQVPFDAGVSVALPAALDSWKLTLLSSGNPSMATQCSLTPVIQLPIKLA